MSKKTHNSYYILLESYQLTMISLSSTKPPLSVPIQVVELTNIPAELRATAYAPDMTNEKAILERNIYRYDDTVI
jgi:hypothetical protein